MRLGCGAAALRCGGIKPLTHGVFLSVPKAGTPPHPTASPSKSLLKLVVISVPSCHRWSLGVSRSGSPQCPPPHSRSLTVCLSTGFPHVRKGPVGTPRAGKTLRPLIPPKSLKVSLSTGHDPSVSLEQGHRHPLASPQLTWGRDPSVSRHWPLSEVGVAALRPLPDVGVTAPRPLPETGVAAPRPPASLARGEGGEGGPSLLRSAPLGLGPPPPRPFIPGLNLGCARAAASLPPRPGRVSSAPAIGLRPPAPAL